MRFGSVLVLTSLTAFLPVAYATSPHLPSPQELGAGQAVLDFCGALDDDGRNKFDAMSRQALKQFSPQKIADMKASAAYQQAYAAVRAALGKLPAPNALAACKAVPNAGGSERLTNVMRSQVGWR